MGTNRYKEFYGKLFSEFVEELKKELDFENSKSELEKIPGIFLPLSGEEYFSSACRILFLGKETYGWGGSLYEQLKDPELIFSSDDFLSAFKFCKTSKGRRLNVGTFWGFVLKIIADLNGMKDWKVFKNQEKLCDEEKKYLKSFLYGNIHSIETLMSKTFCNGKPDKKVYNAVKNSSISFFDKFKNVYELFEPDFVVVLYRNKLDSKIFKDFFEGYSIDKSKGVFGLPFDVFQIKSKDSLGKTCIMIQTWHPCYIRRAHKFTTCCECAKGISDEIQKQKL